jgi:NodT family efflux transporter outer membrane factor (OMF) lipoprotein
MATMLGVFWRRRRVTSACVLAMVVAGCNLDWEKPDLSTPLPEKFREGKASSASPIAAGRDFAVKFGSKELVGLINQALADNLDIAAAAARIREADAQARMASSALYPNIALQDIARTNRAAGTTLNLANAATGFNTGSTSSSSLTPTTNKGRNYGFFQLGISAASYTLDFWGVNEDASYASRILANSSRFDRDVVEITAVTTIMNAYFQVLTAQDRLRIAHNNVAIAEKVSAAVQARFEAGTASGFDTAQQEAVVARQRATIPPLEQTLRQQSNILVVLLGRTPESLAIKGGSLTKLKFPKIDPGLPSEVLLRRPDVARAEAQLASQEFTVMQARASFFPQLTLIGPYYGAQSALTSNLLSPQAMAWQAATQITQPIFDGYNLQGNYENAKGRYAELAALYRKQILTALSETENALIAVKETGLQLKLQGDAVSATRRAFEAADMRLQEGIIDVVAMSVTQNDYFTAQDQEAVVRLNHFQAATSLYQALGGGWSPTTRNAEIARANAAYDENKGPWP